MTTMFVQLRRVVYLLVLLHFCTCVAYAESGSPVNEHVFKQKAGEFEVLWNELKHSLNNAEVSVIVLGGEIRACDVYSTRALNAVEQLKRLTKGTEAEMSLIHTSTTQKEMKEKWKEEKAALQEANDVLSNVPLAVNITRKAAEDFNKTLTEMERLSNDIISEATKILDSPPKLSHSSHHIFFEVEKLVVAGIKDGKDAQSFVAREKSKVRMAFEVAKEAEEHAESLELEVESFQKYLEKHGLNPEDSTTDSQQNNQTNELPEEEKEADENTAEDANEEGNVETPENNNSSQSNTPKPSDSSASGTSPSQEEETTNSPSSSAPDNLDNTQSSDNSSSPALVHSPLLLLVSMCVLGCTAVF
ncbi:uncharacterized protein TM35_000821020 [Trypanosoma theileri]|uniref:Uncharacterized protein n=1 Tax=Trypanosoma theileri TaxID=67003 RepID=A0A1X0NES8_9TRYP|nr:uncharacterized protein TM35_000821020 [Trypanosoma theileri]ORC82812.1 hypothetical protein TM35_000821020 [Trypanosoma theileri]